MPAIAAEQQDSITTEIDIAAPPERVFAAITDAQQMKQWWISPICESTFWEMDGRVGGKWGFSTTAATKSINGVNEFKCRGEILEFDPPRLLVYTWVANWNDKPESRTVVRWELTPTRSGTRLKLTHSGLADQKVARELYQGGWPGVLNALKTFAERN
ncbi:MAG TPA: SRPBCC domain-containing protein [Terriglobales bacterium]|nr:SRPBCC domain-containing protein [Terriglobales bacterium]